MATLSDADVAILQRMVMEYKNRSGNTMRRPAVITTPDRAPDVFIALTPHKGIGALTPVGTGSGNGAGDIPGDELCDIYTIDQVTDAVGTSGTWSIRKLMADGIKERVFNLSESSIPGDTWIVILRDRAGRWLTGFP